MSNSVSHQAPLIPMSEMFTPTTTADSSKDSHLPTGHQQHVQQPQKGSLSYSLELIDNEITSLDAIQSKNNEEIKKRLADIQSLRENNLVVVGAIGGLKKIKEKL